MLVNQTTLTTYEYSPLTDRETATYDDPNACRPVMTLKLSERILQDHQPTYNLPGDYSNQREHDSAKLPLRYD